MRKFCPMYKWIPVEKAIIDAEYCGFTLVGESGVHFCSIVYKGKGVGWKFNKEEQAECNIATLQDYLTFEEQEEWYKDKFNIKNSRDQLNLMGLFNDMYDCSNESHEMDNSWIASNWYEMAYRLKDEDFYLIGVAPAPWHADYIFGENNSIALVCEYDNGERFWCHGSKIWIEKMRNETLSIYKKMMGED